MPTPATQPDAARAAPPARARSILWRRIHRASGLVLAAYLLPHLVNHVLAVGSVARHLAFMHALRAVVRIPAVEALLLACVACQVASGIRLLRRRPWRRAQAWSGACLAFFLLVHVGAVLGARWRLGLDTNFYFAAAGLQTAPWFLFFVPYYAAALVALTVHLACALRLRGTAFRAAVAGGAVLAITIVATFAGALYPVTIPPAYLSALRFAAP